MSETKWVVTWTEDGRQHKEVFFCREHMFALTRNLDLNKIKSHTEVYSSGRGARRRG